MLARLGIAVVLVLMLASMMALGLAPRNYWQLALCGTYFAAALGVRLFSRPALRGRSFDPHWASTIGLRARPLHLVGYGDEEDATSGEAAA